MDKNLNEIKNGPILFFLVMSFLTLSQLNNLYLKKSNYMKNILN